MKRAVSPVLSESLDATDDLIRFAQLASAPYDRFVWEDAAEATRVAAYLLARGAGEIAPPAGRTLVVDGEPCGILACMTGAELTRRRVGAAFVLSRAGSALLSETAARRARLASQTFCQVSEGDYYLARLAVAPEFRGRGLGQWLVERLMEMAAAAGSRRCWLEVDPENRAAITLYHAAGFRIVANVQVRDDVSGRELHFAHMSAPVGAVRESRAAGGSSS